jgi:hypothetical protein
VAELVAVDPQAQTGLAPGTQDRARLLTVEGVR